MKRTVRIALGVLSLSFLLQSEAVLAGPPLLCHPIEIGESQSLPWGDGTWSNDKLKMDDGEFLAQTLQFLSVDAPVLVRMETIRRATIHVAEHPDVAADLRAVLQSRVTRSAENPALSAKAMFDLGYLLATYEQMNIVTEHNPKGVSGKSRATIEIASDIRPYDMVRKASELSGKPAEMEFALALITLSPASDAHKQHLEHAVAGAEGDSLLAINLLKRFGRPGDTLADLQETFGATTDGERR